MPFLATVVAHVSLLVSFALLPFVAFFFVTLVPLSGTERVEVPVVVLLLEGKDTKLLVVKLQTPQHASKPLVVWCKTPSSTKLHARSMRLFTCKQSGGEAPFDTVDVGNQQTGLEMLCPDEVRTLL